AGGGGGAGSDAPGGRRQGDAGRGLPRGGVHLADARPDGVGDQEGGRRGRGAPHRQELLGRRDDLRDGGRPGPGRRGRGPERGRGRRRGRQGLALHPGAAGGGGGRGAGGDRR